MKVNVCASKKDTIWICAFCNEIIYHQSYDEMSKKVSIKNIKSEFKVYQSDIDAMRMSYDGDIINKNCQVLWVSNNKWNYLNTELVPDSNSIVLCPKYFENNLEHRCIIARGNDHVIIVSLPELIKPSQNTISLMRLFGWTIHMNNKTSSGHYIDFASDSPSVCTKNLPTIDNNYSPQVTFIGVKEQWRMDRKNYKNVYHISATVFFIGWN